MPFFCTDDNTKIYYEERGNGENVVFIHGWDCNRHFFSKQVPAFAEKYHVLTFDLRGHGDSDRTEAGMNLAHFAKDEKDLIDNRGLKNVVLIGWSMGVHIIWEYINNYGCENLKKVVLIDMTAKMMAEPDENWPHTIFDSYTRADGMAYLEQCASDWPSCVDGFVPAMFSDGPRQELIPWIKEMALKNTPHVMVEMWLAIIQKDYRDMLDKIIVPCLYTYGSRKSLYTKENAEWLEEHIPNCEIAAFDGGHIHFLQDSDNFNKVVMEFIDK